MTTPTITIKEINIVGTWKYTCSNTDCVCKRPLYMPTLTEIENKNINVNNVVFGECGHGMHQSCIDAYLKTYDGICPLDKLKWKQQKGDTPKYNVIDK